MGILQKEHSGKKRTLGILQKEHSGKKRTMGILQKEHSTFRLKKNNGNIAKINNLRVVPLKAECYRK